MASTTDAGPDAPSTTQRKAIPLAQASNAVVGVHATVPEDALTASVLGTDRSGSGVCIRADGLIATIGYLVVEADSLWVTTSAAQSVPAHVVGYDQSSGLGLIQTSRAVELPALPLGDSRALELGERMTLAGHGGPDQILSVRLIARHEFAGYWEYLLDEALFTTPAHPNWGGAVLLGANGAVLGIGSLLVQVVGKQADTEANMIIPIQLLEPILDDLLNCGRRAGPARPWLGMFVQPAHGELVISRLYRGCPAEHGGLREGDVVVAVAGADVAGLAGMYRQIWALGPAGVEVPLTIVRVGTGRRELKIQSADRDECLRPKRLH